MFRTSPVHLQELFYKLYVTIWYVVIRVLLDTSSRYEVVVGTLQVLLNQIAAMHLYSFILMFSYICIIFACWAVINLIL